MSIDLTPEQQKALDLQREPQRVLDPRTRAKYRFVPEQEYEVMREALEDERLEEALHAVALSNAAGRFRKVP